MDFGILQIEAKTSYDVTKSVASTVNVTDLLAVPGKRYGYDQAKVEFRTFWIREVTTRSDCSTYVSTDYGTLKAITTAPFFSSCVSTVACTPKP